MSSIVNEAPRRRTSAALGCAVLRYCRRRVGCSGSSAHGLVAYSASQRTCEIGVPWRSAPRAVYKLILGETTLSLSFGLGIGIVASIAAATALRTLLFSIRTYDVTTLATVAGVSAASGAS